jgi:3',5'-cyclic AMP phosphodiesterase CpdA
MPLTRREFLVTSATGAAALAASSVVGAAANPVPAPSLVFAHLTDMHIKPTGAGPAGLARCLRHVQAHPAKPQFILNGGDGIMSALGASEESTRAQWAKFTGILKEECRLPLWHMIGNHDCWGWQRSKAGTTGQEPLYGKKWAMQELGMDRTYYTRDMGGWRFVILDSVQERGDGGYLPVIDEEQYGWLEATLKSTPAAMPVLIASHVPILSVTPYFFKEDIVQKYQFHIPGALMHQDVQRLVTLLRSYPQVKLCISGHTHLLDDVIFEGRTYLCNGAVSGSWWHGDHKGCPPGYAIIQLWPDGTFRREYLTFGNGPEEKPGKAEIQ